MKFLRPLTALLLLTACQPVLRAEDLPRANAGEEAAVRALLGKKSTITGRVTDAFESPKGMTFLNLEGGKFTVVAWKDSYDKFEGGSPAKLYKDKTIEVSGQVFEFRPKGASKDDPGKLEIKLTSPDQVKILPTPDAAPSDEKGTPGASKEKPAKPKKEAKEEKPASDSKEPAAPPAKEPGERVDPKKYFK